ncbi:flagellin [Sinorhizobium americanum]|uniref:Flagellin n=1 Tax=Sinorhizobium americanum TaxID=194963 RepID=A0A1L3LIT0_9HYPH|nr:flagellin [Sinorhizobium americanum]APG83465.1 flagellin C [Sinorhizobium americanum CCGM7]APG90001.1 flagellin C [Sinorhizobium americanum]OAP42405.1 flagellin [Sinorhizobium americanum]TCN36457.1 flagellin [Sinorhizobium americanum]
MTSILTNTAAMAALQTLRAIDDSMETTQARVSSGLRVGEAADNAAYWSIATTMRSDNMALSAVQDALGLGAAKVDTSYAAMESAIEVVKEIKSKIVAATEEGVDKTKIQEEIDQLQEQLMSIAESASFSGENWVAGDAAVKSVVSGFVRASDGTVSVKTTAYTLDDTATGNLLFGGDGAGAIVDTNGILGTTGGATIGVSIYALDITGFDTAEMAEALTLVEDGLQAMTSAASELGSISMRIGLQEEFVAALTDSIDSGIGRLVDADMNEESTRLKALQTQQQLAVQSLSIANTNSENILQLFRQ